MIVKHHRMRVSDSSSIKVPRVVIPRPRYSWFQRTGSAMLGVAELMRDNPLL